MYLNNVKKTQLALIRSYIGLLYRNIQCNTLVRFPNDL